MSRLRFNLQGSVNSRFRLLQPYMNWMVDLVANMIRLSLTDAYNHRARLGVIGIKADSFERHLTYFPLSTGVRSKNLKRG